MLQLVLSPVNLFLNDNYQVVSQFCLVVCVSGLGKLYVSKEFILKRLQSLRLLNHI